MSFFLSQSHTYYNSLHEIVENEKCCECRASDSAFLKVGVPATVIFFSTVVLK